MNVSIAGCRALLMGPPLSTSMGGSTSWSNLQFADLLGADGCDEMAGTSHARLEHSRAVGDRFGLVVEVVVVAVALIGERPDVGLSVAVVDGER